MVCTYCSGKTQVINSRWQKRPNQVWRRRRCVSCEAVFTTVEGSDLTKSLVAVHASGAFAAFQRDKLMLSIYDAVKHRKTAQTDASALTDTVISKVLARANAGAITQAEITQITHATLKAFDAAAATHYLAYHSD